MPTMDTIDDLRELWEREFTTIQKRIMRVLSDCQPHPRKELHGCLSDPAVEETVVRMHVSMIRNRIRKHDWDIVCQQREYKSHYRLAKMTRA